MDISRINDEIASIASIFEDSFLRDTPKAWQQANTPPAFSITIVPDTEELQPHVSVKLHVAYTRTYPKTPATFSIHEPCGLSPSQCQELTKQLRQESLRYVGEEMIMTVAMFCASYITSNNTIPKGKKGKANSRNISLAAEMTQRAKEQEEAVLRRAEEETRNVRSIREQQATELAQRIEQDVQHKKEHMLRRDFERNTDDMLSAADQAGATELLIEAFESGVFIGAALRFDSVKLSFPRRDGFATVYHAEPVSDGSVLVPPLELHRIEFDADYYSKGQGYCLCPLSLFTKTQAPFHFV